MQDSCKEPGNEGNDSVEGIKKRPGRHAAENAREALRTLVNEGAIDDIERNDDEYETVLIPKEEIKVNGSGNSSQSDSQKAIRVCE